MTKEQFLEELKQALNGNVPADVLMDSYSYYANYIEDEMRKGRSEKEVIDGLSKPSLIARSIIAAQTGQRQVDYEYTEDGRTHTVKNRAERENSEARREFSFDFSSVLSKTATVMLIILLILIFYFVIKIGFWVLVTFGIPILIMLGIVYLIMYFSGSGRSG